MVEQATNQGDQPQISGGQSALTIAAQTVPMPTFHTVQKDWYRLRKQVSRLANPIPWARDLGWCSVSLAVAFALAFVAWMPVRDALAPAAQVGFAWIAPFLFWGIVAGAVVAALSFSMYGMTEKVLRSNVDHLLEDMDEMHPAPSPEPPRPSFLRQLANRFRRQAATPSATSTGGSSPGAA